MASKNPVNLDDTYELDEPSSVMYEKGHNSIMIDCNEEEGLIFPTLEAAIESVFDTDGDEPKEEPDEEIGRDWKQRSTFDQKKDDQLATLGNLSTGTTSFDPKKLKPVIKPEHREDEPDMNLAVDLMTDEVPKHRTQVNIDLLKSMVVFSIGGLVLWMAPHD